MKFMIKAMIDRQCENWPIKTFEQQEEARKIVKDLEALLQEAGDLTEDQDRLGDQVIHLERQLEDARELVDSYRSLFNEDRIPMGPELPSNLAYIDDDGACQVVVSSDEEEIKVVDNMNSDYPHVTRIIRR